MNKVILIGNLGADPESSTSSGGTSICKMRLATTQKVNGEDKTQWHRLTAFGKTAEVCARFLQKGKQAAFEGRIEYGEYTDKDGNKRYTTDIIVDRMYFVGSGGDSGGNRNSGGYGGGGGRDNYANPGADDDIPF